LAGDAREWSPMSRHAAAVAAATERLELLASGTTRLPRSGARQRRVTRGPVEAATARELAQLDALRPRCRAECAGVPRPCPFVGCRYNLYLEVHPTTGTIRQPAWGPEEVWPGHSCVLDVIEAEPQGLLLSQIGVVLHISRERARQLEARALQHLALLYPELARHLERWADSTS